MPLFMGANRYKINASIIIMPFSPELMSIGHNGLFSDCYGQEELAAAELSAALE